MSASINIQDNHLVARHLLYIVLLPGIFGTLLYYPFLSIHV